jgi:hypothetical protein
MKRGRAHHSMVIISRRAFCLLLCFGLVFSFGCAARNAPSNTAKTSDRPPATAGSGPVPTTTSPLPATTAPPTTTSASGDLDRDGVPDQIEDQLVLKFAPVVRFHVNEQYLPASVPWYLERVRMRFDVSMGLDKQLLNKGNVTVTGLLSQTQQGQTSGLSAKPSDFFLEQTDASGGDNLDSYRQETRQGSGQAGRVCYAHVRPAPAGTHPGEYDIQYVFFYAYNGDLLKTSAETAHEADMEHITVRVGKDHNTIDQIYYAAHDAEGKWYGRQTAPGMQDGYSVNAEGRPVVYSAVNSHASYPWAGAKVRGNGLPDDVTGDGGSEWDTMSNAMNVGEKSYPRHGMLWIQYSGRWGELGTTSFTGGPLRSCLSGVVGVRPGVT